MPENKVTKTKKESKKEPKKEKSVEDVYKKMTQHQHILELPDTYIGGITMDEVRMFIFNSDTEKIEENVINYVGGLYKIFDEIIVNARDHTVRDPTCKNITIEIDKVTGEISVWNDGAGIPVVMHKEHKVYIPELIFGNLLTSENYGRKGKTVGGKNGLGSKLSAIFSKRFEVHTVGLDKLEGTDAKKVEYKQEWKNNMYDVGEPVINKKISQSAKTFTKITFTPDYERFGMNGLTDDMYSLMMRRCYDIAACTPKTVKITLNGKEIKCRDFKDYIKMYYGDDKKDKPKITHEKVNSRWEIGIGYNINVGDRYISFVNGISTFQGGAHVVHVVNTVVGKVIAYINAKREYKDLKILPVTVKRYLTFFINCVVEDPGFNSQTKEFMNSKVADWCRCGNNCPDTKCEITDDFIEKLCAGELMTEIIKASEFQSSRELAKTDGRKVSKLNIDKLEDAKWAGGRNSHKTSIFLTEGDSAKSFAVSGISVIGNQQYGVFPLKGKVLNVRNAGSAQIKKNKEFINIKAILGLKQGVKYKNVSKLRYGSVIIMTDQDPDGSHIKGLIINMLEFFWPELLKIEGFIKAYNTPIVKTWKKGDKKKTSLIPFYSIIDYENWKKSCKDLDKWEHKYYKGLGTSTGKEAKESFYHFENNLVTFEWEGDPINADEQSEDYEENIEKQMNKLKSDLKKKSDEKTVVKKKKKEEEGENEEGDQNSTESVDEEEENRAARSHVKCRSHQCIDKVFNKYRVTERKLWLQKFKKSDSLKYGPKMRLTYSDFFDRDMIFFSNDDNDRSIPSMTDGLKPSQRMIMYCCFLRGRRAKEIKVAQLAGFVSEHTDYHHGEASLQGAIIGLAQNFPGSNNINLLKPNGCFGYRRLGGEDHASPRYIFTQLEPVTSYIFREEDEEILIYNYDDDTQVEPQFYAPIIPMVLVNGAKGIGTGFSVTIYPHKPTDVINNIKLMINGKKPVPMMPWYNGFKGTIELKQGSTNKYTVRGKYTVDGNKVHITDIPIVNGWIAPYEKKMEGKLSLSKDDSNKIEDIDKELGNNLINMKLTFKGQELQKMFKDGTIDKYLAMVQNISVTNLNLFNAKGKMVKYDSILDIMEDFYAFRLVMYEKRKEYYLMKLQNDLDICNYRVKFIKEYLAKTILIAGKTVKEVIKQLEDKKYPKLARNHRTPENERTYNYLTELHIVSLTTDKIKELENEKNKCQMMYDEYNQKTIKEIWLKELDELSVAYNKWCAEWEEEIEITNKEDPKGNGEKNKGRGKKGKNKKGDDENEENEENEEDETKEEKKKKSKVSETVKVRKQTDTGSENKKTKKTLSK